MLRNLFRSRRSLSEAESLYALAADQARNPEFYTRLGVADRIDARFELYTLHVLLLVMRLRDEGDVGAEVAQAVFDTYVSALDNTLRELGVGDISMAKKMRALGQSLYGRMKAYEPNLRDGDSDALSDALARNVYGTEDVGDGRALADYALRTRSSLATQTFEAVLANPAWPEIAA